MYTFKRNAKEAYKKAFTLAEILIALTIIGVVSMMVLPTLQTNVRHKVLEAQAKVATRNIMEGVAIMTNLDRMGGYADTNAFVQELKKHIHIVKICTQQQSMNQQDGAKDCWHYTATQSTYFRTSEDPLGRDANYFDATSFVTADGTQVLISYNRKCHKDGLEPRTCFVAAFDVNGEKQPNTWGEDMFLINSTKFRDYEGPESIDMSTEGRSVARVDNTTNSNNNMGGGSTPSNTGGGNDDNGRNGTWNYHGTWDETSGMAADPSDGSNDAYAEPETSGSYGTPAPYVP